jgi:hypothetical protein
VRGVYGFCGFCGFCGRLFFVDGELRDFTQGQIRKIREKRRIKHQRDLWDGQFCLRPSPYVGQFSR